MTNVMQQQLQACVDAVQGIDTGAIADYIPELASVSQDLTHIVAALPDGQLFQAGNAGKHLVSLQSTAKLIVLIGLLEEFGADQVFDWVNTEPSGDDFASIIHLEQFGPVPSNPMLNAGSIVLCSHIPGNAEAKLAWLDRWTTRLFGQKIYVNQTVFASERRTGDRNRSLAYLLKSHSQLADEVEQTLETYFVLCSFEAQLATIAHLPLLLANRGCSPEGEQVISAKTVQQVVSIMATCGVYNDSGKHLLKTGMPAKSGVSGLIIASAIGQAGVAAYSPRVNDKGNSIRASMMLERLARDNSWHFAT